MSSSLEGKHRIEVLLLLLSNGPMTKLEIVSALKIGPTILLNSVLPALEESNLVQIKTEHRGLRKIQAHVVSLTIFGQKVAAKLQEIDDQIREAKKHAKVSS